MAEIWGMALAVAGGAVVGGVISAQGAQSAASTQAGAAENAQQISLNEFNTITGQEQPFMQAGYGAQNELDYLMGIPGYGGGSQGGYGGGSLASGPGGVIGGGYSNVMNGGGYGIIGGGGAHEAGARYGGTTRMPGSETGSPAGAYGSLLTPFSASMMQQYSPAYQFQAQQGRQGTLNMDASGAGALSGAAQKDLMSFNQNFANTAFNNAFNQYQAQQGNFFSRLAGISQLGQAAAANTGQQGTALSGQAAQSATNVGTALAAGQIGQANAYSGAIQGASYLPWLMQGSGSISGDHGIGMISN